MFKVLMLVLLTFTLDWSHGSELWPNHDISTLKLLQVVLRHGDRAPYKFMPNDPYSDERYWPDGHGQLTREGKYRLYKIGQFFREGYEDYLGHNYSVRELYVRSSVSDRCIESVQSFLAGAYPPRHPDRHWSNGSDAMIGQLWQPVPIYTFMPDESDYVLNPEAACQAARNERNNKILNRTMFKELVNANMQLFDNLTRITGQRVFDIVSAVKLYRVLQTEAQYGYYWTDHWTKEEEDHVIRKLAELEDVWYTYAWDSPVIKRLRAGGLVRELNNNLQKAVDKDSELKKVYVYSTHGSEVSVLMHALNIFNNKQPPFGASLYLEFHESDDNGQWVRAYYHNETLINGLAPNLLTWNDCRGLNDCPLNEYFDATKHLLYDNFELECNQ